MSRPDREQSLLPKEQLDALISQLDLLVAMYPSDDGVVIDEPTRNSMDALREWCSSENGEQVVDAIPSTLTVEIAVPVEADIANSNDRVAQSDPKLQVSIDLPVRGKTTTKDATIEAETSLRARLRQPSWMNRTQMSMLNAQTAQRYTGDVFSAIEYFRDEATKYLMSSHTATVASISPASPSPNSTTHPSEPLVRVWFYFPSLSTRAKRTDLVTYAPAHDLTGFVLAGKPGILCLEGTSRNIDEYMKFIKTESWGDIPSYQKKVSERYREDVGRGKRVFHGMQEITDAEWMGEKRGERGNRSDLKALEGWLDGLGLRGVFERVLMN